jgi:fructose-bisphosphate aldolase, class I
MFTVLWAYLRNSAFKKDGVDYHVSADLTGQANHLAAPIEADIVKQKQPQNNGGYRALGFGKTSDRVYDYMGRVGMINSGGASSGHGDLAQAVRTAVINKRAGGMGLIVGRKSFQRPMSEGWSCSTRSRTSTSTRPSTSPDRSRDARLLEQFVESSLDAFAEDV